MSSTSSFSSSSSSSPPGFAREPLAHLPTPLERADRLGAALGLAAGRLWVKRDDCTGLAGGGNKVRKLETLVADARAHGAEVLVTGGGPQSNHARATAAAANRAGLDCVLVLAGHDPSSGPAGPGDTGGADAPGVRGDADGPGGDADGRGGGGPSDTGDAAGADGAGVSGNVLLDVLLGATIVWAGPLAYADLDATIERTAADLTAAGRPAYAAPIGGSSPIGVLGYVAAADEIEAALDDVALVVTASGSGGTQAGLVAGLGDHGRVLGVDVGARPDLEAFLAGTATAVASLAGRPTPTGTPVVDHDHVGPGYAVATPAGRAAAGLAARTEGLVLDPVYTSKALAGLVTAAREGALPDGRVVFVHTGGLPGLFAAGMSSWVTS